MVYLHCIKLYQYVMLEAELPSSAFPLFGVGALSFRSPFTSIFSDVSSMSFRVTSLHLCFGIPIIWLFITTKYLPCSPLLHVTIKRTYVI